MTVEPHYHPQADELEDVRFEKPFTKRNWKSLDHKKTWYDVMPRMKRARNFAEWYSCIDPDSDRQGAIIHVNNYNREKWMKRIGEHNLHYRDVRYTEPYNGFSHKHYPTDERDPERVTYAIVSPDKSVVEKMYEAETERNTHDKHDIVGKFLGFPKCCRNFFLDDWVNGHIDPMYEVTCNTEDVTKVDGDPNHLRVEDAHPRTNVMWRYLSLAFITHIPCSWDCEHSKDVAQDRYRIMVENGYQDEAECLFKWLKEPMVWSGWKGIAHIKNRFVTGETSTSSYWEEKTIEWVRENDAS